MAKNTKNESVLYELQKITDNPRYEGFAFANRDSIRGKTNMSMDFMPDNIPEQGRDWTMTRMASIWQPQAVVGRVLPFNDFPCVNLSIPVFSNRAVEVLRQFLEPNGELLPLVTTIGPYFVYNIITVADVLDQNKSKIKWASSREVVALDIQRYVCSPGALDSLSIFRIVEMPASTFVSQNFVDEVHKFNLKGFNFIRLWPRQRKADKASPGTKKVNTDTLSDDLSVEANAVVIMLPSSTSKPTGKEKKQVAKFMDELDAILYRPDEENSATNYFGSLKGDEHASGTFRLFLSCPDADALVEHLRPLLRSLSWPDQISVLKRYGEYDDPDCREEYVDL